MYQVYGNSQKIIQSAIIYLIQKRQHIASLVTKNYDSQYSISNKENINYKQLQFNLPTSNFNIPKRSGKFGKDISNLIPQQPQEQKFIPPVNFDIKQEQDNLAQEITQIVKVEPHDESNLSNPQFVSLYNKQIFDFLKKTESRYTIKYDYMANQTEINPRMRAILIDWLIDVSEKFKLKPETIFQTVQIIDRYLEKELVSRKNLQLLGIVALFLACKYEEIYAPEMKDLVNMTDKAYCKRDVLLMEGKVVNALNFNFTIPTSLTFFERYWRLENMENTPRLLALYILYLSLVEYKMIKYSQSQQAASAVYLANKLIANYYQKPYVWSDLMIKQTGYQRQELKQCVKAMGILVQAQQDITFQQNSLSAVKRKFLDEKFMGIAKIKLYKEIDTINFK